MHALDSIPVEGLKHYIHVHCKGSSIDVHCVYLEAAWFGQSEVGGARGGSGQRSEAQGSSAWEGGRKGVVGRRGREGGREGGKEEGRKEGREREAKRKGRRGGGKEGKERGREEEKERIQVMRE